jgi:hypothetical protein
MRISTTKNKTMEFQERNHIRRKIVVGNKTIEQASSINEMGFNVSYWLKKDIYIY